MQPASQKRVRVVVLDDYQDVARTAADWTAARHRLDVTFVTSHVSGEDNLETLLRDAEVIVAMRERTPLSAALLARLPQLELVVTTGMRNDSIGRVPGVTLCGTESLITPTVEMTWALILGFFRNVLSESLALRKGQWQQTIGEGLNGKTLGILGLGRIGQLVARAGKAFGMRVIAWSPNLREEQAAEIGVTRVDADTLFTQADIVSVHLRLGDRSRGLVDRNRLRQMKSTALLVNTARAEIVESSALLDALREEQIAGAALDVFNEEPLPADHPILSAPNTLLTPHLGYVVRQNYELFYPGAVEAINAFYDEQPIRVLTQSN